MTREPKHDSFIYQDTDGIRKTALAVAVSNADGSDLAGGKKQYMLLDDANRPGDPMEDIAGGNYICRVEGDFNGAVVTLKFRSINKSSWYTIMEADGVTPMSFSDDGSMNLSIAQGSTIMADVEGGAPAHLYCSLGGY